MCDRDGCDQFCTDLGKAVKSCGGDEKAERDERRAIDTQPKAEESPTSPLDRNAPTGVDV